MSSVPASQFVASGRRGIAGLARSSAAEALDTSGQALLRYGLGVIGSGFNVKPDIGPPFAEVRV